MLLFCLASDTNVAKAVVNNATVRSGLIERGADRAPGVITDQGTR
jgi:hypothetical protein